MNRRLTFTGLMLGNALLLACFVVANWAVEEYDVFAPFSQQCPCGAYYPITARLRNDGVIGGTRIIWDWKGKPLATAIIDGGNHAAIPRFQWLTIDGEKPPEFDQVTALGGLWSEYNLMFKKVREVAKGDAI